MPKKTQPTLFSTDRLREVGINLFTACGAPPEEAEIVAEELVEASLMGLDSHGVMRYIWYTEQVLEGRIKPGAPIRVIRETATTAVVDCGFNFGPVSARRMVEIVAAKAKAADVACAVSRNCHHVGRLGSYVQALAEQDLIGFGTANSAKHGHWVVPWGGREGRLATNPLAYAVPTETQPVVLDMSTSMIAEGKIRLLMHKGEQLPAGSIQDAEGNPTTDPNAFYGPPRGTILPFGGPLGYKGFGLGLLVEILGGILSGVDSTVEQPNINGLCLIAINPEPFCGLSHFRRLMTKLSDYMTSTPPAPGYTEVLMPGALDFRTRRQRLADGVPVAEETWRQIVETARKVGVEIE